MVVSFWSSVYERGVVCEGIVAYLDEEDVCACLGECDGDGLSDASCAACDEGRLALEGEESVVSHCCGCGSEAIVRLELVSE